MKRFLLPVAAGVLGVPIAAAQTCDCTKYPFTPNPPCFNTCVVQLSAKPPREAGSAVQNIDPGVYVGIRILSENRGRSKIDFARIKDKQSLESAAAESLKSLK